MLGLVHIVVGIILFFENLKARPTGYKVYKNPGGRTIGSNAISSNASAIFQAYKKGACLANPSFVQIHPTGIVSAKVSPFALLPQGRAEANSCVLAMMKEMDACGFGNCTNHRMCEAACPKEVSITHIARFNREFLKAAMVNRSM